MTEHHGSGFQVRISVECHREAYSSHDAILTVVGKTRNQDKWCAVQRWTSAWIIRNAMMYSFQCCQMLVVHSVADFSWFLNCSGLPVYGLLFFLTLCGRGFSTLTHCRFPRPKSDPTSKGQTWRVISMLFAKGSCKCYASKLVMVWSQPNFLEKQQSFFSC